MARRSRVIAAWCAVLAVGLSAASADARSETAVFAGGCFWSMEHDMEPIPGVTAVTVGYTGGRVAHPTYEQVSSETTGHLEAVKVTFDPDRISYAALVEHYWRRIDPTDDGGAFCDRGASYHSAIFVDSPEQRRIAEASKAALQAGFMKGRTIVTPIRDAAPFWPAETYHQHYAAKDPVAYWEYRTGCGRDRALMRLWGRQAFN
ncbi:MAG: peptide-methionine (S)-S-oxide reductase MsrA [Caulobacteraceae bacterium]|nr:peptide-methionine (S)-S-oxide reductase MsrA [Caulobacteraceae bacterium]